MRQFIATFYTHLSAMRTQKALAKKGIGARLAPVPRKLSSSCGTCVFFESAKVETECLDEDFEAVYECEGERYSRILSGEQP